MAQTLDEIIKETNASYDPSRQLINEKIAGLGGQLQSDENALKAQEQDYFQNTILGGARERGVAFGGIPEGERARYGAAHFLPAVARLRTANTEARSGLLETLAGIDREQRQYATGIREGQLNRDEQARQFNEQLAANERASVRQAAAAKAAMAMPTLGTLNTPTAPNRSGNDPAKQKAMQDVQAMLGRRGSRSFYEELIAIGRSAAYGNPYDQAKLELLQASQPGLFRDGRLNEDRARSLAAGASF